MTQIQRLFALLLLLAFVGVAWSQETPTAEAKPGDTTPTRPEAEFDWAASLLIVEADWSKSESAKEIEADLRKVFAGQVGDEMMENLPKHGAQLLLPYDSALLYEAEDFDNLHAWLEKHKLVKSVQHGFVYGDYSRIGERVAEQTGYPLPMRRLMLFPGGVPPGAARQAILPLPSLKPWSDGRPDQGRVHEPNSVHYLWSFGLTRPGEKIFEELESIGNSWQQQTGEVVEQVQAESEIVSGRRVALSFPPAGSKQGPKIRHDCWYYFPQPGDRVAVFPWFIADQQRAKGQIHLLVFHTSKSRMPGFEGWDETLKNDEVKQWKPPTPGIHMPKSALPLTTRVTSRVATARLLKIKSDWSAVPAARQIKLEVLDALRDVPVAQELLDKLPASAPEILFAPGVVSLYRGENSGKLLAWLKSKDLLISAERFPPPDPGTVFAVSDSSGSGMGYGGASKSMSGSGSRSGMKSGGSSMGPSRMAGGSSMGSQTGMKGRPSPRSPEAASSMDRYALHLTKDGQFIPLPRLSQFTSQPFVKRKPELSWTIISQGGFDNPQIFSRHLAALEELRGEAPRMLQPVIDATSFHFTLPADHAAVMQAFPAASEVAFRDAAREMGFLALIILEGPDIAGVQESTEPQLVLPDKVHTPPVKHEPNLRWGEAGDRAGSGSQVQSTGAPLTKILHLQHASASGILKILQQLYPTDVKLAEDERTNAIIVSGPEGKLAEMEAIALRLDEAGSAAEDKRPEPQPAGAVAELKQQFADAEQEAARLAKESKPAKDKLRAAVAKAFELRQKLLQAELAEFRQRTERIEKSLQQRQGIKQQIIERRVEDLLKPGLEWEGADAAPTAAPAKTAAAARPSPEQAARSAGAQRLQELELQQAEVGLRVAEAELAGAVKSNQKTPGLIPQAEVVRLQAQVDIARLGVEKARAMLELQRRSATAEEQ